MKLLLILPLLLPSPPDETIRETVEKLLSLQEGDGSWPYEGGFRVDKKIPLGYRVGGTACVATALLHAAPDRPPARAAIDRGLAYILKTLADPALGTSTARTYDVRIWGQAYALDFLCRVERTDEVRKWIKRLVRTIADEELKDGGWTYAFRKHPASFVTAPVVQALLRARAAGFDVPEATLNRARTVLESARATSGAYLYVGTFPPGSPRVTDDKPAGSAARSAVCETTLLLLGAGSLDRLQAALDAFHHHWAELEKRRRKKGAHAGAYEIAPYYFYFGHRYAAQAIGLLPKDRRPRERKRLLDALIRTRDADGTWNDRTFDRSKNYGTAMALLVLLGDRVPAPSGGRR